MCKITNCELNANTAKAVAQRVMRDKGMRIAKHFVPAESNYVVNLNPSTRLRINLFDDSLVCLEERKIGNRHFITGVKEVKGPFDEVQEAFYALVKDINKLISR